MGEGARDGKRGARHVAKLTQKAQRWECVHGEEQLQRLIQSPKPDAQNVLDEQQTSLQRVIVRAQQPTGRHGPQTHRGQSSAGTAASRDGQEARLGEHKRKTVPDQSPGKPNSAPHEKTARAQPRPGSVSDSPRCHPVSTGHAGCVVSTDAGKTPDRTRMRPVRHLVC